MIVSTTCEVEEPPSVFQLNVKQAKGAAAGDAREWVPVNVCVLDCSRDGKLRYPTHRRGVSPRETKATSGTYINLWEVHCEARALAPGVRSSVRSCTIQLLSGSGVFMRTQQSAFGEHGRRH